MAANSYGALMLTFNQFNLDEGLIDRAKLISKAVGYGHRIMRKRGVSLAHLGDLPTVASGLAGVYATSAIKHVAGKQYLDAAGDIGAAMFASQPIVPYVKTVGRIHRHLKRVRAQETLKQQPKPKKIGLLGHSKREEL
jgi:hypothetical protein